MGAPRGKDFLFAPLGAGSHLVVLEHLVGIQRVRVPRAEVADDLLADEQIERVHNRRTHHLQPGGRGPRQDAKLAHQPLKTPQLICHSKPCFKRGVMVEWPAAFGMATSATAGGRDLAHRPAFAPLDSQVVVLAAVGFLMFVAVCEVPAGCDKLGGSACCCWSGYGSSVTTQLKDL